MGARGGSEGPGGSAELLEEEEEEGEGERGRLHGERVPPAAPALVFLGPSQAKRPSSGSWGSPTPSAPTSAPSS